MGSSESELTSLTADIVAAYVAHNVISGEKLPDFIGSVYAALSKASLQAIEPPKVELTPAVPVKKSLTHDYIICLENGKRFKSLKRHLKTHYDLSHEEYWEKWGLPRDYPMVAPAYAAARSSWPRAWAWASAAGPESSADLLPLPPPRLTEVFRPVVVQLVIPSQNTVLSAL